MIQIIHHMFDQIATSCTTLILNAIGFRTCGNLDTKYPRCIFDIGILIQLKLDNFTPTIVGIYL